MVLFSLLMNMILLKFITNMGIRGKEQPVIRWSNVSKPAIGGLSLYVSFLLSTACYSIFFPSSPLFHDTEALGIIGATALAFLMGLADDAYNTRPWLKFFVQLFCGFFLILSGNFIHFFELEYLNYGLTIFWIIGIMNSINMLDNMDGITATVSSFILLTCLSFLFINGNSQSFDFIVILGVLSSLMAFLFFNWNPSKMFMGDTGSQFLGMFIAAMGIKYIWNSSTFDGDSESLQKIFTVLIAFILPIVDTTSVVINRLTRKQSPFVGGKDHTTHHLSYLGLSDGRVAFVFLGLSVVSLIICIGIFKYIDTWRWYHSLILLSYFLIIFGFLFGFTQMNKDKR
jgi:UDP-GlcNAc:undecaprenyl-phosphate GlcNAc-1-phosphate transferase